MDKYSAGWVTFRAFILKGATGSGRTSRVRLDAAFLPPPVSPPRQHANCGATPMYRRLVNYAERAARCGSSDAVRAFIAPPEWTVRRRTKKGCHYFFFPNKNQRHAFCPGARTFIFNYYFVFLSGGVWCFFSSSLTESSRDCL